MKPTQKKIILFLIVFSELLIGGLGLYFYYKHNYIKKPEYITAIDKESLTFPETGNFVYFYELEKDIKHTVQPEWLDHSVTYNHNKDGFNDRYDYSIEKGEDTFRIITLGDSFTYGQYVPTEKNWTETLEDDLNNQLGNSKRKFEVINLGMPGYDIPYIVERYERHGQKYNPDLVIWLESSSGFIRNTEETKFFIDNCEEKYGKDDPIIGKHSSLLCWEKAQEKLMEKYGSEEKLNEFFNLYLDDFFNLFEDKRRVVFFTFEQPTSYESTIEKLIKFRRKNYPEIKIESIVPDINKLEQVFPDSHPNEDGHKTIEKTIFSYLEERIENNYWSF
jgi:hypothetical protein